MNNERLERLHIDYIRNNSTLDLMGARLGNPMPDGGVKGSTLEGNHAMSAILRSRGGYNQQDRMIRDKLKSMLRASTYSYQGALVKKHIPDYMPVMDGIREADPWRALINPNKVKQDYDEKVISIPWESGFEPGDVFEWCNTGTHWLIYLQDLTELAYFKGNIRKCTYLINWMDEDGNKKSTYAALRGPVETRIEYIQKNGISVDIPNYSLNFYVPKNTDNLKFFKRYKKFYLANLEEGQKDICWRIEAVNAFTTQGIIEVNAVEYYANEHQDADGYVDILTPQRPAPADEDHAIIGETFIKPKKEYIYYIEDSLYGDWYTTSGLKLPLIKEPFTDEEGRPAIKIKWNSTYSGQFDLWYGDAEGPLFDYKKTIVVESLF